MITINLVKETRDSYMFGVEFNADRTIFGSRGVYINLGKKIFGVEW